jgi:hypothetical protein
MQKGHGNGSIRIAKGRVLQIGNHPDLRLAIAVHRFGPVPVALVPDSVIGYHPLSLEIDGLGSALQLGVYPNFGVHANRGQVIQNHGSNGEGTVTECLLSYRLGLDAMLLKYLEDVAEHLHDIEHYLPLKKALRRARKAEETLAGSVKGKIEQIRTHLLNERSPLHQLAFTLFQQYEDWIVLASHARILVLFILNEYYSLNDIRSRTKYVNDWNAVQGRARKWLGPSRYAQLAEGTSDLGRLVRSFAAYHAGNLAELDGLLTGDTIWVNKLVSFARYVLGLKHDNLRPASPRVFFSGRHKSPETENLFLRVTNHFAKGSFSGRPVQVVCVDRTPPGDAIDRTIKRRISASHAIITAITREDERRLDYIIKELEHATRGDEAFPVRPFVEEGVDLAAMQNVFFAYKDYFAPLDSRIRVAERQQFIGHKLTQIGFSRFREHGGWIVSAELERELNLVGDAARERFVFDKIHGLLQFFTHEHRLVLKFAVKHGGRNQRTKEWLSARIAADMHEDQSRVESLFARAWAAQKNRALVLEGAQYTLLTMPSQGRYQSNVRAIVRRLWPELGDGYALEELVVRVIDGIE